MTHLKTWWFREQGFTNFGDELGHTFLSMLGHEVERVPFGQADILTTGSILQVHNSAPLKSGAIIWGSGWHRSALTRPLPRLDVRAVRGRITARQLRAPGVALGDPGLLASHFWEREGEPEYEFGFVRHYIDQRGRIPGAVEIDTRADPEEVCRMIASCASIVSSSLHGCIVADSYGIPNMRLHDANVVGGDVKWIDYASALSSPVTEIQRVLMERISDL